jgi:hypothetical protein
VDHDATGESDLGVLLASMSPVLNGGSYVFVLDERSGDHDGAEDAIVTVAEPEGRTLVLPRERAESLGLPEGVVGAWITLQVHSARDAGGLTAAVAAARTPAGISANVVAGYFHDHLFVPEERRDDAMSVLAELSARAVATAERSGTRDRA